MATSTDQRLVLDGIASDRAQLVYLYVASVEGASSNDVADALAMDKLTVLPIVRSLCRDGRLTKEGTEYVRS